MSSPEFPIDPKRLRALVEAEHRPEEIPTPTADVVQGYLQDFFDDGTDGGGVRRIKPPGRGPYKDAIKPSGDLIKSQI